MQAFYGKEQFFHSDCTSLESVASTHIFSTLDGILKHHEDQHLPPGLRAPVSSSEPVFWEERLDGSHTLSSGLQKHALHTKISD